MVTKGERGGGETDWEFGSSRYKLLYIYITDKQQGPTVYHRKLYLIPCHNHNGNDHEKEKQYI